MVEQLSSEELKAIVVAKYPQIAPFVPQFIGISHPVLCVCPCVQEIRENLHATVMAEDAHFTHRLLQARLTCYVATLNHLYFYSPRLLEKVVHRSRVWFQLITWSTQFSLGVISQHGTF